MSKKKASILVIDDDQDVLFTVKTVLKREYETIQTESSPNRLETLLKKQQIDLIILDMNFKAGVTSGNEGLYWLRKIKEIAPEIQVLMNTAYGDIQLAVESMKLGAVDFLVKPWQKETLLAKVNQILELHKSKKKVEKLEETGQVLSREISSDFEEVIYSSARMTHVFDMARRVAATDASVLITGENGTGKEVLARFIHKHSERNGSVMIKVDLGTLTESLFESEIFGHVKGAFTDAKEDRPGRFEIADGGTLFLDEIGNLNPAMQSKLLTVLQSGMVTRVGSSREVHFDVRVISATNMPLYSMVDSGDFRQDLLYRINTVELEIPPLRDRREDILPLAQHFLKKFSEKYQKPGLSLEASGTKELESYNWPGNIRELQHTMERAVIMSSARTLRKEDFLMPRKQTKSQAHSLKVEDVEKNAIQNAIRKWDGNLTKASEELGIGRTTLYRKMKKYEISEE